MLQYGLDVFFEQRQGWFTHIQSLFVLVELTENSALLVLEFDESEGQVEELLFLVSRNLWYHGVE
jgi:hypothetical protein